MEFEPFPKIPRLRRDCTITEKIDGTNAQVLVQEVTPIIENHPDDRVEAGWVYTPVIDGRQWRLRAGSRTRYITPGSGTDNHGFAAWVWQNAIELTKLGEGRHFGEWYGAGIQRRYGLDHKRFALFNTARWGLVRPRCCDVVPVLYTGVFSDEAVERALELLRVNGSVASPYFYQPEGVIVYMHASGTLHKVLIEGDELPKGVRDAS